MKLYRLYYIDRDGSKNYVCYIPTAQLGLHFCADPDRCSIYADASKAQKEADWFTRRCGNVEGECMVEEYSETRSVSRNRWKEDNLLLTDLVPRYEQREWNVISPEFAV